MSFWDWNWESINFNGTNFIIFGKIIPAVIINILWIILKFVIKNKILTKKIQNTLLICGIGIYSLILYTDITKTKTKKQYIFYSILAILYVFMIFAFAYVNGLDDTCDCKSEENFVRKERTLRIIQSVFMIIGGIIYLLGILFLFNIKDNNINIIVNVSAILVSCISIVISVIRKQRSVRVKVKKTIVQMLFALIYLIFYIVSKRNFKITPKHTVPYYLLFVVCIVLYIIL